MMKTSQFAMEMCFYCEEAGGQTQFVSCKNKVIILTVLCLWVSFQYWFQNNTFSMPCFEEIL